MISSSDCWGDASNLADDSTKTPMTETALMKNARIRKPNICKDNTFPIHWIEKEAVQDAELLK